MSRALSLGLLALIFTTSAALGEERLSIVSTGSASGGEAKINNGLVTSSYPSTGMLFSSSSTCTATLIGCQTALTAAHCVCSGASSGAYCTPSAAGRFVYFQHSGIYSVTSIAVHPEWEPSVALGRHDIAVLHLNAPVAGVQPSPLNTASKPGIGTMATLVGFGRAPNSSSGIKRAGLAQLVDCADPYSLALCYNFENPIGSAGEDSTACPGDSGGPMFTGSTIALSGVTSGGFGPGAVDCTAPVQGVFSDVFTDRDWVQNQAGADLGQSSCGGFPNAGSSLAPFGSAVGTLNAAHPADTLSLEVPSGTNRLQVLLNAEAYLSNDFDLYVRRGSPPTTTTFDCASHLGSSLEGCGINSPAAGTWYLLVNRFAGDGAYQLTATTYKAAPTPTNPDPPAVPGLTSPSLPGFRIWVRISDTRIGTAADTPCPDETVCVAGAIATRAEVFVRIVGPKPNGYLWPNIVKFNTTKTEVWIQQISTGATKYYLLPVLNQDSETLPGLVDKTGFVP